MQGPISKRTWRCLQRQCVHCKSQFKPHPRLGLRQKTCGKDSCRRKHRAGYRRHYRIQNPESEREYELKRRSSRSPDFWKSYRKTHSIYAERNRAQTRLRKKLEKAGLQRQLDIVQLIDPPEKLSLVVGFATSHRSLLQQCSCQSAA